MAAITRKNRPKGETYTEALASEVCALIGQGISIRKIGAMPGMPGRSTIMEWIAKKPEFKAIYTAAREVQAEFLIEQMGEIESRVLTGRVESHAASVVLSSKRWRAEKMAPKKYGARVSLEHSLDAGLADAMKQARERARSKR